MAINEAVILENEWFQDWKAQGLAEGIERGRRQGAANVLLRQISLRFGQVPDWASARAATAGLAALDVWLDRVLDAKSIDEIFA